MPHSLSERWEITEWTRTARYLFGRLKMIKKGHPHRRHIYQISYVGNFYTYRRLLWIRAKKLNEIIWDHCLMQFGVICFPQICGSICENQWRAVQKNEGGTAVPKHDENQIFHTKYNIEVKLSKTSKICNLWFYIQEKERFFGKFYIFIIFKCLFGRKFLLGFVEIKSNLENNCYI